MRVTAETTESAVNPALPPDQTPPTAPTDARPYLGILFECCSVYARVYRRPDQHAYIARCPKCLRAARIRVATEGSSQRFFLAH